MTNLRLALLLAVAGLMFAYPSYREFTRLRARLAELDDEVVQLEDENRALREHVEGLETDPLVIERSVRDVLGYGREGEIIYRVEFKEDIGDEAGEEEPGETEG